jgi:hypothetical protein
MLNNTIQIYAQHHALNNDLQVKLSKVMVRLLRYDYDKRGVPIDRDGCFCVSDLLRASPLRHFQISQVVERIVGEPQRFSVKDDKVRVHFGTSKAGKRSKQTRTTTPDLAGTTNRHKSNLSPKFAEEKLEDPNYVPCCQCGRPVGRGPEAEPTRCGRLAHHGKCAITHFQTCKECRTRPDTPKNSLYTLLADISKEKTPTSPVGVPTFPTDARMRQEAKAAEEENVEGAAPQTQEIYRRLWKIMPSCRRLRL